MYEHVLLCVAPDHRPGAERAKALARGLCAGGKLSAVSVLEEIPGYVSQYIDESAMRGRAERVRAELARDLGDADGAEVHVLGGHPGREITDWAESNGVDCIVVASHRPGLSDYFLGSTAGWVVRHAGMSVHVVR